MTLAEAASVANRVFIPLCWAALLLCGLAQTALWLARRRRPGSYRDAGPFIVAFTSLGLTVGFATAYSRTPAVGAVLPSLLALISAVFTYAVSKDAFAPYRPLLAHGITLLCLSSLLGLSIGSTSRADFDDYQRKEEYARMRYEQVDLASEKAKFLVELEIYKEKSLADLRLASDADQGRPSRKTGASPRP